MQEKSLSFLKSLLDSPGPSGFETLPARVWRDEAASFADRISADVSGNSVAAVNPDTEPRVMLAGHIDEIGLMIVHVDDDGYLYFSTIGGWDPQVLVGQRVAIATKNRLVDGVIGKRAVHMLETEEREQVSKVSSLWIDIGAKSKKEALRRVRIGDPAVLAAPTVQLPGGRLTSRSIDNRIGAFVVLEALRMLERRRPKVGVFAVATSQEEISWTGGGAKTSATRIDPRVAIVVDLTHATDHPTAEKKRHGDFKLGGGPVISRGSATNPQMVDMLIQVAEASKIPYALAAAPGDTGTDADSIYCARQGIATGLVSIPTRYMHSPNEMVDLADVQRAAKLLAAFARKVTPKTDFTPH
jgi:endoglucanase